MVDIKPIRTEEDHAQALARIDEIFNAEEGTPESDELDLLTDLVCTYEDKHMPIGYPNPIAAIEFRMDQAGLSQRDLVTYIGSRAKVSEVLSGKRAITMAMARALHEHLGIPAEVLLQRTGVRELTADADPRRFPLREMAKRGWVSNPPDFASHAQALIDDLFHRAGGRQAAAALYRKNDHQRMNAKVDPYALEAWCLHVLAEANAVSPPVDYERGVVTHDFLQEVAHLSSRENGVRQVRGLLAERGIAFQVAPHLPKTHLDGAALWSGDGRPVIGLTLRYDRIDSFWFSLLHELAHVSLHLDKDSSDWFVEDFTLGNTGGTSGDLKEQEANEWAQNALIPSAVWEASPVREEPTAMAVIDLAQALGIHPAMVAGRVRYEQRNYHLLSQFVGTGQVRRQFASATGE